MMEEIVNELSDTNDSPRPSELASWLPIYAGSMIAAATTRQDRHEYAFGRIRSQTNGAQLDKIKIQILTEKIQIQN
jgi:hypothetical protein